MGKLNKEEAWKIIRKNHDWWGSPDKTAIEAIKFLISETMHTFLDKPYDKNYSERDLKEQCELLVCEFIKLNMSLGCNDYKVEVKTGRGKALSVSWPIWLILIILGTKQLKEEWRRVNAG